MGDMDIEKQMIEKYIAFIDVLGFKNLVFGHEHEKLNMYFNTIDRIVSEINKDSKSNLESLIVSDSIIFLAPLTKEAFTALVKAIGDIQTTLLFEDIWLRGGISFGKVCFDKALNVVVGEGLINAYLLEQQAKFPRIIIDMKIVNHFGGTRSTFQEALNKSGISQRIIETMESAISKDAACVSYGYKVMSEAFRSNRTELVYEIIRKRKYSDHIYYEKYLWVHNYLKNVLWDERFIRYCLDELNKNKPDYHAFKDKFCAL